MAVVRDTGVCVEERELHVLAVDDNSVDRTVLESLLRDFKHRVTAMESGVRALETLLLEPDVNMIITDYSMPEMTSFELLKRIKESKELRKIPVVIMSSENVPTQVNMCMKAAAEDFLLKPVQRLDVSRVCSRLMR